MPESARPFRLSALALLRLKPDTQRSPPYDVRAAVATVTLTSRSAEREKYLARYPNLRAS